MKSEGFSVVGVLPKSVLVMPLTQLAVENLCTCGLDSYFVQLEMKNRVSCEIIQIESSCDVVALITEITSTEPLNDTFILISLDLE